MVEKNIVAELVQQMTAASDHAQKSALAAQALRRLDRFGQPVIWASVHGALGASLAEAGQYDETVIGEILHAYRCAQSVFDPARWPGEWLLTERNIAATHLIALSREIGDSVEHASCAILTYANALARGHRDSSPKVWNRCIVELVNLLREVMTFEGPPVAFLQLARACEIALLVVPQGPADKACVALRSAFEQCGAKLGRGSLESVDHLM
jgi:hypothetical protein